MRVCLPLLLLLLMQCRPTEDVLFDGTSFHGWEGDTLNTWRIEEGSIIGGSLVNKVPHNDFLCTRESYDDFVLRLQFKLTGSEGFVNAGVQFRSERLADPAYEMKGYQADLGPGYWGSLYDESRRNKILASADSSVLANSLRPSEWNDYEIRAEGRRIRLYINGVQTVDYTEPDTSIPQSGIIGLQVHGGGKAQVHYRAISLEKL